LLDELTSGVPTAGAPDIARSFALSHSSTALIVFVAPGAFAMIVEPIVFLLADRFPRKWFVAGGLAAMAASAFIAASAPNVYVLAAAFGLWYVATGSACAIAQATLVDADPEHRARTMVRWTLCSAIGDVAGPVLLAALAVAQLDWRAAFVIVGAVLLAFAFVMAARPFPTAPSSDDEGEDRPSTWDAFKSAVRDPQLMLWLFATALCDLLDEILVVFASLHVRLELGAGPTWQAVILGSLMIGGVVGVVVLERLLTRYTERRLLIVCACACAISYAAWLAAPWLWLSAVLMFPVGATAATLYPLAAARAYACVPGRASILLAISHLFTPLGLALPWLLGVVADRAGTWVALALLLAQPLGLAALAAATDRR
jgi:predicted MFS family arabinose efflux permease